MEGGNPCAGAQGEASSVGKSIPTNTRATTHSNSAKLENDKELIDLNKMSINFNTEFATNYVET